MRGVWIGMSALAMALGAAPGALAANEIEVEVNMSAAPDAPSFADGEVRYRERGSRSDLRAEIEDVPVGAYQLYVDGVLRGTANVVVTGTGTEGELEFRNPVEPGKIWLNFDPRGALVEWKQGGKVLLSNILPRASDLDPGDVYTATVEWGDFGRTSNAVGTETGSVRLKAKKKKADLRIRLKGLEGNAQYILTADGMEVGTITTKKNGKAKLDLSTKAKGKKLPLDFDPARAVFEVWDAQGDRVLFAPLNGKPVGGGLKPPGRYGVPMANTGAEAFASGEAEVRERKDRLDFQVEVEDLSVGSYDVFVDGVLVGSIDVVVRSDGSTHGEIEFSTDADEDGKLPLEFDPAGATIDVVKDGTVYLTVVFPA